MHNLLFPFLVLIRLRLKLLFVLIGTFLLFYAHPISASAFQLSGRITNQAGNPIPQTQIIVNLNNCCDIGNTATDINGNYQFTINNSGFYNINAIPPADSGLQATVNFVQNINSDFTRNFVLIPVGPTFTISGRVLDRSGNGLPNQIIGFSPLIGNGQNIQTDASGNYSIQLPPDIYVVYNTGLNNALSASSPENYSLDGAKIDMVNNYRENYIVDMVPPAFNVTVHVTDLAGNAVSNAKVITNTPYPYSDGCGCISLLGGSRGYSYYTTPVKTSVSGDANLWLFPATHPSTPYTLSATAPSGTPTSSVAVNVGGDRIVTVVLPFISNQPPQINPIADPTINEGGTYSTNGSFNDPSSTSWTATVDYGDGSGVQPLTLSGTTFSLSHLYKDNGMYTVIVRVTNNQGAIGTGTATVTVNNANPSTGAITAPVDPVIINTAITASSNFTDPGVLDTHIAVWDWRDGTTSNGTVTESNGSGSVSDIHTYTAAGVYIITLTVTDKDGGVESSTFQYVVVYDPSAGYVTGAGTITSPIGAYTPDPTLSGKAIFGFVSRYQNGANLPTGSTQFRFVVADFTFKSTSYDWLVVGGARAQYKGSGTINGTGDYSFILSSIDGQLPGGGGTDKFRIKITDKASGNVIYDNQIGASDTSDPATAIDSGSITIHN